MIKANELRVGNLLNYQTAEGDVVTLTTDFGAIQWATEDPKGFNLVHTPMPLTEELLVKFGFEKNKKKVDIYEIGRLRIWIGSNGRCLAYIIEEDTTFGHYIPVPIEYVHQLQNLYFAITGEELTIKN